MRKPNKRFIASILLGMVLAPTAIVILAGCSKDESTTAPGETIVKPEAPGNKGADVKKANDSK